MLSKIQQFTKKMRYSIMPVITVLISIFIPILPYKSNSFSILMPLFTFILVYFWSIYRPRSLSYLTIFLLGLLKDITENGIPGLNALCLLIFSFIVRSQRKYIINRAFVVAWAGFTFFLSIIILISILLVDLTTNINFYSTKIIFLQWLITIFIYIPTHLLLNKLNNMNSSLNE